MRLVKTAPSAIGAKVLVWERPHRLVLAWQLTSAWQYDPSFVTELEVTFTPDGANRTLVTLEHRNLERFEDAAAKTKKALSSNDGWPLFLSRFTAEAGRAFSSERKYYLCRLIPPRPTFPFDMTEQERAVMGAHVAYWTAEMQKGTAVLFGPVLDPTGPWGVGIFEVSDQAELDALIAADPAPAGTGSIYEILPMAAAVVRP